MVLLFTGCGAASASAPIPPPTAVRCTASIPTFSVPGATNTFVVALNNNGQVAGSYDDESGTRMAFVMDPCGTITTFSVPGASSTTAQFINQAGDIAGYYTTGNVGQRVNHIFVRSWTGSLSTIELPNENLYQGSAVLLGFTDNASVVGMYLDSSQVAMWHGFLQDGLGHITTFLPDGSISAQVDAINAAGELVGTYVDSSKVSHGFVVTP